jgi:hypothetical protein
VFHAPLPTLTAAAIFEAAARQGRRQDDDDSDDTTYQPLQRLLRVDCAAGRGWGGGERSLCHSTRRTAISEAAAHEGRRQLTTLGLQRRY